MFFFLQGIEKEKGPLPTMLQKMVTILLLVYVVKSAEIDRIEQIVHTQTTSSLVKHGMDFSKIGRLIITGNHYIIKLELDTATYFKNLDRILKDLHKVRRKTNNAASEIFAKINPEDMDREFSGDYTIVLETINLLEKQTADIRDNFDSFMATLEEGNSATISHIDYTGGPRDANPYATSATQEEINEAIKYNRKHGLDKDNYWLDLPKGQEKRVTKTLKRGRRGLIDGLGQFSQWLAGTALQSDVEKIFQVLDNNKINQEKLFKDYNLQSSVINATIENVLEIDSQFERVTSQIKHLEDRIATLHVRQQRLETLLFIELLTNQLIASINNIADKIQDLQRSISEAYRGNIDSFLFKPYNAIPLLKSIDESNKVKLPYKVTTSSIPVYYKITPIFPRKISKTLINFVLLIPLKTIDTDFDLFETTSIPIGIKDTNLFSKINPEERFLAVSTDRKSFVTLMNLERCTKFENTFHCNPSTAILGPTSESCLVSAFLQKDALPSCERKILQSFEPALIKKNNEWIYSVDKDTQVGIRCHYDSLTNSFKTAPKGIGILHAPATCSLTIGSSFIPAMSTFSREKTVRIKTFVYNELPDIFTKAEKKILETTDQITNDSLGYTSLVPVNLRILQSKIHTIERQKLINHQSAALGTVKSLMSLGSISILIIIFILSIIIFPNGPCSRGFLFLIGRSLRVRERSIELQDFNNDHNPRRNRLNSFTSSEGSRRERRNMTTLEELERLNRLRMNTETALSPPPMYRSESQTIETHNSSHLRNMNILNNSPPPLPYSPPPEITFTLASPVTMRKRLENVEEEDEKGEHIYMTMMNQTEERRWTQNSNGYEVPADIIKTKEERPYANT